MEKYQINIKKVDEKAKIPTYGTEYSAGCDLYALLEDDIVIEPNKTILIRTGISMELNEGTVGLIYARSSAATKKGLAPANKVGVIDSDYRGEILVPIHNHSKDDQIIENGERIAQLIIMPYYKADFKEVEELNDSVRNTGGFGSTGK